MKLPAITTLALLLSLTTLARAGDGLEAGILRDLDTTARKYAGASTRLRALCGKCGGQGKWTEIIVGPGGGAIVHPCTVCDRRGWTISRDAYRTLFWELKSPAFRASEGAQKRVDAAYSNALKGKEPARYSTGKVTATRLVDSMHGEADVVLDSDPAFTTRWVRAEERPGRLAWFRYDADTDGPWPVTAGKPPVPPVPPTPLSAEKDTLVREALRGLDTFAFKITDAGLSGDGWLMLTLAPVVGTRGSEPDTKVGASGVTAMRALFPLA